jgi:Fic family protein
MLFQPPELTDLDQQVLGEIEELRLQLRYYLREPRRWQGQLRKNLKARAIRGSNSIEGYDVSLEDAVAIVEEEEPLDADKRTVLEIQGYRNALTYVQQLAEDNDFVLDESLVRSLHFMMLGHDLSKSPGQYRRGEIFVDDEERGVRVYVAPDADLVRTLMPELIESIPLQADCPLFVRAAMAHLNLVMIHPFRDGNGRMARALQTLILARERVLAPEFSSIEEWLGRNTQAYYEVLAQTGGGTWHPEHSTRTWVRFNLTAHYMQAKTVLRRTENSSRLWVALQELIAERGLDERVGYALYAAAIGLRVLRSTYEKDAEVEQGTASRDLRILTNAGLLVARGATRARYYTASPELRDVRTRVARERTPIVNPYTNAEGVQLEIPA